MSARTDWHGRPLPAFRREAWHGDRVVTAFAERPRGLDAMLRDAARRRPDTEAVVAEDADGTRRVLSWRGLDAQASRLAAAFAASGIRPGERVAMLVGNRAEFVTLLFGIQRAGAIAVPVGTREQRAGLAYVLRQCGAAALVFDAELADRLPDGTEAPALRLRLPVAADGGTPLDDTPSVSTPSVPEPAGDAVSVILYTSGTTGHPKGAMLTHDNVAHSVLHYEVTLGLREGDRGALAVPASHVTGLIALVAAMTHVAGTIVIAREFKAPAFIGLLERERATYTLMVPAMYALLLMQPGFETADLSAWRLGGYGGAPMPAATIDAMARRLPSLALFNAYGATETTSPTTLMPPELQRARLDSVGLPLPCARVMAVDEDGRELPPGTPGELWIAGPMVVPGYWDDAAATARSFTAGWWHSGDVGSVDADGFVRVLDRSKDMLNRGGYKIYSAEVENVLMALPGVVEAAVVGRPCPVLGERVHAFVHAPRAVLDKAAVRAHCAALLADYKVPETVTLSAEPLPRNANGKLLKRLLRERLAEDAD